MRSVAALSTTARHQVRAQRKHNETKKTARLRATTMTLRLKNMIHEHHRHVTDVLVVKIEQQFKPTQEKEKKTNELESSVMQQQQR